MKIESQREQYTWRFAMPTYYHVTEDPYFQLDESRPLNLTTRPEKYRGEHGDEVDRPYAIPFESRWPIDGEPGITTPGWSPLNRDHEPEDYQVAPYSYHLLTRQYPADTEMPAPRREYHQVNDLDWSDSPELAELMRNRESV